MATFTFSIDFFEKLELKYYNSILCTLANHHCVHRVAFDRDRNLLDVYKDVCKFGDSFDLWLKFLSDNKECWFTVETYSITAKTVTDKDIYTMTGEIIDDKKWVVNSKQSASGYYPPKDNPDKFATIIDYKEADEFINNKNIININNIGSIVATDNATINNPTINNQSVTS